MILPVLALLASIPSWGQSQSGLTDKDRFKLQNMDISIRKLEDGQFNKDISVRRDATLVGTVTVGGLLGIGTTGPTYPIDISAAQFTIGRFARSDTGGSQILISASGQGADLNVKTLRTSVGYLHLGKFNDALTTFTSQLTIDNNGLVGIGTTNPGGLLDVGGGTLAVNGGIVDAPAQPRFETNGSASFLVGNNAWKAIIFNTLQYHSGNLYDTTTGTTTIPAGGAGLYDVMCSGGFPADAGGARIVRIVKNNTTVVAYTRVGVNTATYATHMQTVDIVNISVADTVRCEYFHDSGGALTLDSYPYTKMVMSKRL